MTVMESSPEHRPVLLAEAVEGLKVRADGFYVDGTLGRGGHAAEVLSRLGRDGRMWLLDRDPDAVTVGLDMFGADPRCRVIHGSFAELGELLDEAGLQGEVNGILLDLGVSSPQLDEAARGFSFLRDGPLDMRMDTSAGATAREWLQSADESEIRRVLRVYGEERYARRIAAAVCAARDAGSPPQTTVELANLVAAALPRRETHKHPATRTFQALRIAVNAELDALQRFLGGVADWLAPGGRLVVISFHSLEDRMVKRAIRGEPGARDLPPGIPVVAEAAVPRLRAVGKPVRGAVSEADDNRRARSAVLRVAEKVA